MFGKFFKKKKEITLDELGKSLFQNLVDLTNNYVQTITKDSELPFHELDKNKIFSELLILSLWSLNFLHYPYEIWRSILQNYLNIAAKSKSERDEILQFMESRSKLYFDSWKETSESLPYFGSIIAGNIDESLTLNMEVIMLLINFFVHLTEANAEILKNIQNEVKIIV